MCKSYNTFWVYKFAEFSMLDAQYLIDQQKTHVFSLFSILVLFIQVVHLGNVGDPL